jgi:hypothetical protein
VSQLASAISELEHQKDAIDRALSALRAIGTSGRKPGATNNSAGVSRGKRRLSAEGRGNIIAALKKRWAEKRAAQDGAAAMKKAAPAKKKAKKRVLSAEARKKMADAARKRWAAQKKKQAA